MRCYALRIHGTSFIFEEHLRKERSVDLSLELH